MPGRCPGRAVRRSRRPRRRLILDDVAESATYQLRSMKLAGLSPDRQGVVREAAADCIAAKMAELRRMFVDEPKPGDWDF